MAKDQPREKRVCDVCSSLTTVAFIHSSTGPYSYSRCKKCDEKEAEPIEALCFSLYRAGGPETYALYLTGEFFQINITSWYDGQYLNWVEVKKHYPLWFDNNQAELEAKGL